ncbi:hypothetical protein CY34DRAFT_172676 [Suillus luteus UH-Slu-Lm8-n1]|uniref:Uncharacterized protein n=1 Tax=Suillus luteus UH-Slu-Lm8-n1 TaxID=930992 RepID=A0A0D0AVW8_9AGAM|nr:hypothetical protein CY34DRAFT_172676 [Suillus luteus UH-Slu-Lm8-n1]
MYCFSRHNPHSLEKASPSQGCSPIMNRNVVKHRHSPRFQIGPSLQIRSLGQVDPMTAFCELLGTLTLGGITKPSSLPVL